MEWQGNGMGAAWERHALCESALKHWSVAARLLGLPVPFPPEACMSLVSAVCCDVEVSLAADRSSRRVLPNVVCLSMVSKPRQ